MPRYAIPNGGLPSPSRRFRLGGKIPTRLLATLPALPSLCEASSPDTMQPGTLRLNSEIRVALHDRAAAMGVPMEALANTLLAIALKALKDRQSPPLL